MESCLRGPRLGLPMSSTPDGASMPELGSVRELPQVDSSPSQRAVALPCHQLAQTSSALSGQLRLVKLVGRAFARFKSLALKI